MDVFVLETWRMLVVPDRSCQRPGRVETGRQSSLKYEDTMQTIVNQHGGFEYNSLADRKPMQITQQRCDVFEFQCVSNQSSSGILDDCSFLSTRPGFPLPCDFKSAWKSMVLDKAWKSPWIVKVLEKVLDYWKCLKSPLICSSIDEINVLLFTRRRRILHLIWTVI